MEDGIFFNQSKYIKEMLKKFRLKDSKPTKTPMSTEIKLTKDDEADSMDSSKYRVKSRISHSRIDVVTNLDGVTVSGDQVPNDFVAHYETFLGQQGDTNHFSTVELFPNKLDSNKAAVMVCPLSTQEAWDIMSSDVTKAVQEFFINGKLLKELNHTIIALIPKVSSPSRINDYRPISCCNVLFKCISKIIANHIKESLKVLVSLNQSEFVPRRKISDNILLTQEVMHNYHLDRGVPQCAFKVDIQKAYDTVDWGFLSINGVLHGYFNGKRGLRQDDPLSPYLFTLIMEVLTLMLSRRVRDSELFTYHRYCLELEIVNLCFADDLFLFAHGDENSARVIMEVLDEFKLASGLTPSLPKSTTYFCNVLNHTKLAILQILPFEEGRLPVKYLGSC
ncbi:hypothetical protein Tco_0584366 [Tanacetum coccineum]